MSYSQSKKLTDSEKTLQIIKGQLYGKWREEETISFRPTSTDTSYLRHDLIKTLVLATLAVTTQLIIYFGLQRGIFKF